MSSPISRREVITSALGMGLWMAARPALAEAPRKDKEGAAPASTATRAALTRALVECERAGEACLAHCTRELAAGNQSMGRCNSTVQAMLATTAALLRLVAVDSPHAKRLAALCADLCRDCEAACAEHKAHFAHGMHAECKECMEACQACAKACSAFAA
jgi:Cys-rich four helix bundle protein (predicted Tat secretion target)